MFPVRLSTANQCSARFRDRFLSLSRSLSLSHPLSNATGSTFVKRRNMCQSQSQWNLLAITTATILGERLQARSEACAKASSIGECRCSCLFVFASSRTNCKLMNSATERVGGRKRSSSVSWHQLKKAEVSLSLTNNKRYGRSCSQPGIERKHYFFCHRQFDWEVGKVVLSA